MNLFYLRYFVTLAHVQHYTKAAEQLCIAQPQFKSCGCSAGKGTWTSAFEKNGRKTTLTRFGEEFLTCAEHTLSVLDSGVESIRRSAHGEGLIRLGLLRILGIEYIPRLAANFLKANPALNIQFTFHTGVTQTLLEGLAAKKYDLVFLLPAARKYELY